MFPDPLHIIDKYPTKFYQLCLQRPCDNVAVLVSNAIFDVNKKTQHILMKFSSVNIHTTSGFFSHFIINCEILEGKEYESPWLIPISFPARILWVTMLPVKAILYISIPDCRLPGRWRKMYPLTFIMSVVWIAGFSYVMVWMITIAGNLENVLDNQQN